MEFLKNWKERKDAKKRDRAEVERARVEGETDKAFRELELNLNATLMMSLVGSLSEGDTSRDLSLGIEDQIGEQLAQLRRQISLQGIADLEAWALAYVPGDARAARKIERGFSVFKAQLGLEPESLE